MADLNALIAQGYQFQPPPDPFAQYGKMQQLQNAGMQNQLAQYQFEAAKRADLQANALNQAYGNAIDPTTGAIDYGKVARSLATGGVGSQIPAVEKARLEQETANLTRQKLAGDVAAQPVKLSADKAKLLEDKLKLSRQFLDTLDPSDPNAPARYLAWHEANHADPDIGPALAARGVTTAQARAQIDAAIANGPQAFAQMLNQSKLGTEKFIEMNKPTTNVVNRGGQSDIIQIPGLGGAPVNIGTYADVPLPAAVEAQKGRIAKAGASNINVSQSTEKKYGEAFGGKIADRDVAMLDVAAKAPDLAANANRVLSILSQDNVFTGSAADIKLNMARALNLAGAGNDEKIANTEMLVSGLARQTLGAVKSSGLGTGQGFTDKDLQFLQDAEGGRITLNAQTIQRLAELSHSAADKSATAWNKRVKEIPKSATEGTGLSTEPIVVPKRLGAAPAAPAAGAVQNGYRFKGGDPAVAANWEKL